MEKFNEILAMPFLGNDVRTYATALLVLMGIYIVFRFLVYLILRKLGTIAKKTKTDIDDAVIGMLQANRWLGFLIMVIIYIEMTVKMTVAARGMMSSLLNIVAVVLAIRLINYWVSYFTGKAIKKRKQAAEQFSVQVLSNMIKVFIWAIGILFLISSFGYNISSLVAGLGIGGIAVALAVQNILGDLISSISIYFDKPFQVGDYIEVDGKSGTVKTIGIKTTRITSLHGEEIVMSNKRLTESDINNYGKMRKRRVVIPLGVTYDTKLKKMKELPGALKKIVNSVKDTSFDRAHFKEYTDSNKLFELVFYIDSKDFTIYIDRLEKINLKIQEHFEKNKIEFAYPSQTIYIKK